MSTVTRLGFPLVPASLHRSPHRITAAGVTFDPLCPDLVSKVSVSGVSYLGNKLNFSFSEDSVTLEVTARAEPGAPLLEAELWPSLARLTLSPGQKVSFPHTAGRIQRSTSIAAQKFI